MLGSINRLSLFLPITSLQTLQFHAITHSFAQRRSVIPPFFNSFRTLSIATGVVPPSHLDLSLCGFVPLCANFARSLFSYSLAPIHEGYELLSPPAMVGNPLLFTPIRIARGCYPQHAP